MSKVATSVLNLLWDCGELMIHHVEENRRYYDLTERVLPPDIAVETPSREEYERFLIRKYMSLRTNRYKPLEVWLASIESFSKKNHG